MVALAHVEKIKFFYAIGNTPAVCLTESLPPEQDASLLLLGSGDVRNILFTAFSELDLSTRRLDITCCDLETEILARNIFLLTLLIDSDSPQFLDIWSIYYDINIKESSLRLLQAHAEKLVNLSATIESWNSGTFCKLIRFCDTSTLKKVNALWNLYSLELSHGSSFKLEQKKLSAGIESAKRMRKRHSGGRINLSAMRSAPCLSTPAVKDLPEMDEKFGQRARH